MMQGQGLQANSSVGDARSAAPVEDGGAGSAPVAVKEKVAPARTPLDRLPPWKVLLHNDDVNMLEDVVTAIQQLCKLNHIQALQRTLEAHHQGLALLITTHREHAELLCEQFESKLLTVTIEPER
jgi:ATP-dependent Clp protease adaptor protein ClpS